MMPRRPSRLFLSVLAGLCITATGLLSRWRWPLWPVDGMLDVLRIVDPFGDAADLGRSAILGLLIAVNSAAWAGAAYLLLVIARRGSEAPTSPRAQ